MGELEKGIERLAAGKRKQELRAWLERIQTTTEGRVLDVDSPVAREWGRLLARAEQQGQPLPAIDALIAATAVVHGLVVVTRNTADMVPTGARVLNPWQPDEGAERPSGA